MFLQKVMPFFVSLYVFKFQASAPTLQIRESETATNNQSLNYVLLYLESGPIRQ